MERSTEDSRLKSPELLLMDESLASLGQAHKKEILPYIESLHAELKIPVIYVSDSQDEVAHIANHMVLLEAGKITVSGSVHEIFSCLDISLAQSDDAEVIIDITVVGHDEKYDLTYIEFTGGRFTLPANRLLPVSTVRLRVAAGDISLTLQHQTETSILNIFPATINEMSSHGASQVIVRL